MRESFNALLFPDTRPEREDLRLFLPLCDHLFFYTLPGETALEEEFCTGSLPAVLSEADLSRFLAMTRDLLGHEEEYREGRLASLSLSNSDRKEESLRSLVTEIRSGRSRDSLPAERESIWQALLFLKLAARLEEDEREIARGLATISTHETELLTCLKGAEEEDEAPDFGPSLQPTDRPLVSTVPIAQLVRAWGRLFLNDPQAPAVSLLVSPRPEVADLLAEAWRTRTGQGPRLLATIPRLDESGSADDPNTRGAGEKLRRALSDLAAGRSLSGEIPLRPEAGPNSDGSKGRDQAHLAIHAFEEISPRGLIRGLCGGVWDEREAGTALLAVPA